MPGSICSGLFSASGAAGITSANLARMFLFANRTAGTGSFRMIGSPRYARDDPAADRVARGAHGENFFRTCAVARKIPGGGDRSMEKLESWVCPLCNSPLILREYPSKRGFVLTCKGTDAVPHSLRMYLSGFRKDASFLPGPTIAPEQKKTSRAKELLERASRLAAA
jgi:hypothetical protein